MKMNKRYEVHKKLFELTLNFSVLDWKFIRTPKYYETMATIKEYDRQKEYTLKCVEYYIKNYKLNKQ